MITHIGDLPVIYLVGGPKERGLLHGRALGEAIHTGLNIEREAHSVAEKDWRTILNRVEPFRLYLENEHPDMYQEMEGIAQGAEIPINAIVLINEGIDEHWNGGCSTLVVQPEATRSGHLLMGKNRDGPSLRHKTDALFVVYPKTGPRYVTLAGVGTLARDAINEYGVALFGNGLAGPNSSQNQGVSFAVLRRYLLTQPTLNSIQATLERIPKRGTFNYTLASAAGEAIALESTVNNIFRVKPVNGILVHTNHFVSDEAAGFPEEEVAWGARSVFRLMRLRTILEAKTGVLTIADIQSALSDHLEFPGSVCSHRVEQGQPGGTLNSYCVDLSAKTLYIANGPPCTEPYLPVQLSEIGLQFATPV